MGKKIETGLSLAKSITRSSSQQIHYTIRWLVDRALVADAYRAYGYFRWVDDVLDEGTNSTSEKIEFISRQKYLLEACYRGEILGDLFTEEQILYDLVQNDKEQKSGLQIYLRDMMDIMVFDAERRGRVITELELNEYSHKLAMAVTEAMYYFIGHGDPAPHDDTRYLAATAAHITHMLRDTYEDTSAGYFNIPAEYLNLHGISALDLKSQVYRQWVCERAQLARRYFKANRKSRGQIKNLRCRLANFSYSARFEWMLCTIEREHYCLRRNYPDRKSLKAVLWMIWSITASLLQSLWPKVKFRTPPAETGRTKKHEN